MTLEELEALDAAPAPGRPVVPANVQQPSSGGMTPEQLQALDGPSTEVTLPEQSVTLAPQEAQPAAPAVDQRYDASGQIGGAILTGAAKSIYQTKDFIFGAPDEADKSETRRGIEAFDKELGDAHIANSFVSGLSQFAVGMLGAGKLITAARTVPGVAGAAASIGRVGSSLLEGAGGGASASLGAGSAVGTQLGRAAALSAPGSFKAAAVGAIAFDPSGDRLSNLVEKFPVLQNPVTGFLAAQPGDSRALGRVKNAFESIGVDAVFAGVFAASVAGFKALKSGDPAAIAATQAELSHAIAVKDVKLAASKGDMETVEAARQTHPEAVAQVELMEGYPSFTGKYAIRDQPNPAANDAGAVFDTWESRQHTLALEEMDAAAHSEAASAQTVKDMEALLSGEDLPASEPLAPHTSKYLPNYQTGKPTVVDAFHGTNSDFIHGEGFSDAHLGKATGAPSAGEAHFFARNPETSNSYAMELSDSSSFRLNDVSPAELAKWEALTERRWALKEEIRKDSGEAFKAELSKSQATSKDFDWSKDDPDGKSYAEFEAEHPKAAELAQVEQEVSRLRDEYNAKYGPKPQVIQSRLTFNNPLVYDFKGSAYRDDSYYNLIRKAKAEGHDGAIFLNTQDGGPNDVIYAVFDKHQIRHRLDNDARRAGTKAQSALVRDPSIQATVANDPTGVRPAEPPLPVQGKDVVQQAASAEQQAQGATAQRVDNPTQGAGPDGLPPQSVFSPISEGQLDAFIQHGREDTAALLGPGGWEGALERGYKFGDGGSIPWQKLARVSETGPDPLDFMVSRLADQFQADIAKAKGGDAQGVMHDAQVDRITGQLANLWNEDPAAFLGQMQLAGKASQNMAARMEAGLMVAQRVMQDALNTRSRIGLGMLEQWGGDMKAARADLEDQLQVAASVWSQTMAIRASSGRTMRRGRSEFQLSLEDVAAMKGLDDVKFFGLLDTVGHDFQVANRLIKPGFWARLKDDAAYLYVNNLLWGLRTHFVNTLTNTYMLTSRPLERILGSAILGDMQGVRQNWSQYGYMASAIHEGWRDAVKAWQIGDSVMSPHSVEISPAGVADNSRGTNWVAEGYKQWDSVPNVLSNAYTGLMKGLGTPTRMLGAMDELAKQTTYRSKVMAQANADGIAAGLEGQALTDHVRKTLLDSFDEAGRATDLRALDEANIATFQQDLAPGTIGATVQATVANHELLRFVIPFVKTPTNVLRMGWKLTPGLNMLQGEFRQMIRGDLGQEKQAQAIGQMAMGSLFLGTAALAASQGRITGGGPSDPKLMAALKATGWQPYSFVIPNPDGTKTYVNYGRYDPVAMPFGMVADIIDIASRDQDGDGAGEQAWNAASGVLLALAKQITQKTYLTSLHDTLDAVMDPDKKMQGVVGGMAANFVPASSALRFGNPDPYLRETRGVIDKIMATVPGLSAKLPPKRDVFGDPLTVHKGLLVDGESTAVDAEVRRMVDEAGIGPFGAPSPRFRDVDLRDLTMADGRTAYDRYQELAGHPARGPSMKETLAKIMRTAAYQRAPDGDPTAQEHKGTKQAMLTGTMYKYRESAGRTLMADPNVRQAVFQQATKARAAAVAQRAPKSDQQVGSAGLEQIGQAFGVDLGGVLPGQ